MIEESPAKRGDAAWREQRDAIARRNADAHKRAQDEKRSRATLAAASQRDDLEREAAQLHELNVRLSKQQRRTAR